MLSKIVPVLLSVIVRSTGITVKRYQKFIPGEVVPQTRISESPYKVWICIHTESCEILTSECLGGYGQLSWIST